MTHSSHGGTAIAAALLILLLLSDPSRLAAEPQSASLPVRFSSAATQLGEAELSQLRRAQPRTTVMISPLSVEAALAMVAQGARGPTAANLRSGLRLDAQGLTLPEAAGGFAQLTQALVSRRVVMDVADGLWADKVVALKPAFSAAQSGPFAAQIVSADFADPATVGQINRFVSRATHGMIPLTVDTLAPRSKVVLVNALYFKGAWGTAYDPRSTTEKPFTTANGDVMQTPTMHRQGEFSYYETPTFQSVALPYNDPRYELVLVLMKDPNAEPADDWASSLASSNYEESQGTVDLPRLDLIWDGDLISSLGATGLSVAFRPNADYSGIAEGQFGVSQVIHKTRLIVDEKGTVGAAVTAVVAPTTACAPPGCPEPPEFIFNVDRPFWLLLREKTTSAPIFVGYVAAPHG